MSVMEFQHRFLTLVHHVPDLVSTESTKIHRFIQGLGGEYTDKMEAVGYQTFETASNATMRIEAPGKSRGVEDSSQGPSKRSTSTSRSGSTASSGWSSGR